MWIHVIRLSQSLYYLQYCSYIWYRIYFYWSVIFSIMFDIYLQWEMSYWRHQMSLGIRSNIKHWGLSHTKLILNVWPLDIQILLVNSTREAVLRISTSTKLINLLLHIKLNGPPHIDFIKRKALNCYHTIVHDH